LTIRICVSILPKTTAEALWLIEKAEESSADLIEVRLDKLTNNQDISDLAAHGIIPKIATTKNPSFTDKERQQTLLNAAKNGFNYVDLDLSNQKLIEVVKEVKAKGSKCILSFHDSHGSPNISELNHILESEVSSGADVCKIVTTANCIEDNLALLQFTSAASSKAKIVCFGMGELGKISRFLSPVFGSFFTFASLERGSETALGQMTIKEMRTAYELLG
jgi:3-dehydroquinate dehydratase type I